MGRGRVTLSEGEGTSQVAPLISPRRSVLAGGRPAVGRETGASHGPFSDDVGVPRPRACGLGATFGLRRVERCPSCSHTGLETSGEAPWFPSTSATPADLAPVTWIASTIAAVVLERDRARARCAPRGPPHRSVAGVFAPAGTPPRSREYGPSASLQPWPVIASPNSGVLPGTPRPPPVVGRSCACPPGSCPPCVRRTRSRPSSSDCRSHRAR